MTPLVSICCLTYNHELFIEKAIKGFIKQETDFLIEIIIHDDASTDGTTEIVKSYSERYPNFIVPIIQTENQWSKGIRPSPTYVWPKVRGKYIALCEGDDYWTDPLKLQKQVDFLEPNPDFSLCFHNSKYFLKNNKRKVKLFCKLQKNIFDIRDVIERNWFIPTQSMMFRASYIKNLPDFFSLIPSGDFALQLILALKGDFYYIDEVMSVYRKHRTSLTSKSPNSNTQLKIIELLSYFNLYSNFHYNHEIQKRNNKIKTRLYRSFLYERPLIHRMLNFDFYFFKFQSFLKKLNF